MEPNLFANPVEKEFINKKLCQLSSKGQGILGGKLF